MVLSVTTRITYKEFPMKDNQTEDTWSKVYYQEMIADALKEEDTPDNNGYYL